MTTEVSTSAPGIVATGQRVVERIETDYLVVGAGAMGLAFIDVLLTEDPAAQIVVVDRHAAPGGHWNDAYPYVRLHQPAAFYGVSSAHLGRGGSDLASLPEIIAYFGEAMRRFVATGRVRYLPMSSYHGDGVVGSVLNPDLLTHVTARRRVVDGTHHSVEVPSVVGPRYAVDADVEIMPPNGLARLTESRGHYVIVGAGKTGIDAVVFLLDRGVSPHAITWITPNDSWFWDRAELQPGVVMTALLEMLKLSVEHSPDDAFAILEERGMVFRVDPNVRATKWRCATLAREELAQLRRIDDVVRMGRVESISRGRITLTDGVREVPEDALYVDCSANALASLKPEPIFSDKAIILQSVFMCQQVFSAALIAHIELARLSDTARNKLVVPVPHPEVTDDLAVGLIRSARNMIRCHLRFAWWLRRNRLFLGSHEHRVLYVKGSVNMVRYHRKAVATGQAAV